MPQSDEHGEPKSIEPSEMSDDREKSETESPDRRKSSFPTEIPTAGVPAAAPFDAPDYDPLDSCDTIPVPRSSDSIKPMNRDPDPPVATDSSALPSRASECAARSQEEAPPSPPLAPDQEAQGAATEPVASNSEPVRPDPVLEIVRSDATIEESGAAEPADESKALVAANGAADAELSDEKLPAAEDEATSSPSKLVADDTGDATSTSAHVLPATADPSVELEESAIVSERGAPAAPESVQARGIKGRSWLVLPAVALILGLWWLPRPTPEQAIQQDTSGHVAAPRVGGDRASQATQMPSTAIPAGTIAESATPEAPALLPESSRTIAPTPATPPAAAITESAKQPVIAAEPARLSAYKAAASAGRNAAKCRYAGDSPGVVHVIVTFDSSGRVRRTQVRNNPVNPMTLQCITSKFDELTIPAFSGEGTRAAVDVKIY